MPQAWKDTGAWSSKVAQDVAVGVGSSVLSVGARLGSAVSSTVSAGIGALMADSREREQVELVRFGWLEAEAARRRVLLLGYTNGFQVWDIQDRQQVRELVSRRDGPVRYLEAVPMPQSPDTKASPLHGARPVLAVVPADTAAGGNWAAGGSPEAAGKTGGLVHLYSLRSHTVCHTLTFSSRVLSVCCSVRLLVAALDAQVYAFDANSLQHVFSAVTYPAPCTRQLMQAETCPPGSGVPLALGPRWLAYASNQVVASGGGCALPQAMSPGAKAGGRLLGRTSSYEAAKQYARTGGKQLKQGLATFGEASLKYLSNQYTAWKAGGGEGGSPLGRDSLREDADAEGSTGGNVVVRDVVNRAVVAHFRAHASPLHLLRFDPSGTLLFTASVHGHNINVFHICPTAAATGGAVQVMKLARGMTPAVITDVSVSCSGEWAAISSARGTTHLFHLGPLHPQEGAAAPHLAAATRQGQRQGGGGDGEAGPAGNKCPRLTAVGRVRSGGFLNAAIPGSAAAAAAVNLYQGSPGGVAVASMFVAREEQLPSASLELGGAQVVEEDLYVAAPGGLLTRHCLRPAMAAAAAAHDVPASPVYGSSHGSNAESASSVEMGGEDGGGGAEVRLEAEESWDVCRCRAWPEREEFLSPLAPDDMAAAATVLQHPEPGSAERRCWMAAAETVVHRPERPLWADPQFHILEMQTARKATSPPRSPVATDALPLLPAALQVEEFPVKRVNVQRGELAPVITEGAETSVMRVGLGGAAPHWALPVPQPTAPSSDSSSASISQDDARSPGTKGTSSHAPVGASLR